MIELLNAPRRLDAALTPAEQPVLELLCTGMSNKEIASALGKADTTVKNQISSILRKAGVQSRCQLMAWYFQAVRTTGPVGEARSFT